MSAGFTPGPWSVGPAHVVAQRTMDEEGRRVTCFVAEAVLSAPFRDGEREANARLIAAAPELYAVLQSIVTNGLRANKNAASEVLARARGEGGAS